MRLPMPHLALPKQVEIQNDHLIYCYYILCFVVWSIIILRFVLANQMYQEVAIGQYINPSIWATGYRNISIISAAAEFLETPVCQQPEILDYQWDEAGDWLFSDYQCMPLCNTETSPGEYSNTRTCFHSYEAYRRESRDQVILLTEMEETVFVRGAKDSNATKLQTDYFLVPTVDSLVLSFTYDVTVPVGRRRTKRERENQEFKGDSVTSVLTVILDSTAEVVRVVPPSFSIDIPVGELFHLAGHAGALDSVNEGAGQNWLTGAAEVNGPAMRITGAEVVLLLECYSHHERDIGHWMETWLGPVCYVSATLTEGAWTSGESLTALDAGDAKLHQFYHGVRVRFERSGFFYVFSADSVFQALVDAIVLVGLPKRMILCFMITFLGTLSSIYRRVLFEPFNIMEQLGGMAVRFVGSSSQFVELEDSHRAEKIQGISRERMAERLHATMGLQETKIDMSELAQFVNVCFDAVQTRFSAEKHGVKMYGSFFGRCKAHIRSGFISARSTLSMKGLATTDRIATVRAEARKSRMADHRHKTIDLETYSVACSSTDPITFEAAIDLFDADRRVGFTEWWFTPVEIRQHVKHKGGEFGTGSTSSSMLEVKMQGGTESLDAFTLRRSLEGEPASISKPPPPPAVADDQGLPQTHEQKKKGLNELNEVEEELTEKVEEAQKYLLDGAASVCHLMSWRQGLPQTLEQKKKGLNELNEVVLDMHKREHLLALHLEESDQRVRTLGASIVDLTTRLLVSEMRLTMAESLGPKLEEISGKSRERFDVIDEQIKANQARVSSNLGDLETLVGELAMASRDPSRVGELTMTSRDPSRAVASRDQSRSQHVLRELTRELTDTPALPPNRQLHELTARTAGSLLSDEALVVQAQKNSSSPREVAELAGMVGELTAQMAKLEATAMQASLQAMRSFEELKGPVLRRIGILEAHFLHVCEDATAPECAVSANSQNSPPDDPSSSSGWFQRRAKQFVGSQRDGSRGLGGEGGRRSPRCIPLNNRRSCPGY